ncbi:hypothetical protein BCV72DRAFT_179430, partial [Rhizopus microsporus var. microsporus]
IIWTQTLESITFKIEIHFSEYCLNLHNPYKSISLPLFDKLCLEKIGDQLLEANFLVCIRHDEAGFDTLDFDSVINGQGQKTGLE